LEEYYEKEERKENSRENNSLEHENLLMIFKK